MPDFRINTRNLSIIKTTEEEAYKAYSVTRACPEGLLKKGSRQVGSTLRREDPTRAGMTDYVA